MFPVALTHLDVYQRYRSAVAYISVRAAGLKTVGTAFHLGGGIFVTARQVIEGRAIEEIGTEGNMYSSKTARLVGTPYFHPDPAVDIALLEVTGIDPPSIPLARMYDDGIGDDFVCESVLVLGYPDLPMSPTRTLLASAGFFCGTIDFMGVKHPRFIVSAPNVMGFAGGPVLFGDMAVGVITLQPVDVSRGMPASAIMVMPPEPVLVCLEHHGLRPEDFWDA